MTPDDVCQCITCGVRVFAPEGFKAALKQTHAIFHCINGHAQHFPEKTVEEKRIAELSARLATVEREREELQTERDRCGRTCPHCSTVFATVAAMRGHVTRVHKNGPRRLPSNAGPDARGNS